MAGSDTRAWGNLALDNPITDEAKLHLAEQNKKASVAMAEAALRLKASNEDLHVVLGSLGLLPEQEVSTA